MSNLYSLLIFAFGFGVALTGLIGLALFTSDHETRIRRLESSQPVRNAVVNTTEELVPKFLEVKREYEVLGAHMQNMEMKLAYMRNVGNPDAPWNEIVKWHNEKFPTKPHQSKGK